MRQLLLVSLGLALLGCAAFAAPAGAQEMDMSFTLWQLPSQTPSQMMSYVIRTEHGKIIVIDGGMPSDAPYLRKFLAEQGNRVEAWFLSHPHGDHVGALTEILKDQQGLEIKAMYGSSPTREWLEKCGENVHYAMAFYDAVEASKVPMHELNLGAHADIDGVHFLVLGVKNPELMMNPINNQSVVIRVWDDHKSVLFTGDLGVEAGNKLLQSEYAKYLPSEYVQMAHHGQNGVTKAFYEAVKPDYCLWPTPKWLWDNNQGKGPGTGPWRTLEVRQWMKDLHVKHNYVSWQGLVRID